MSLARFFQMLILLISLPKLFFYLFASHEQAEYEREKLKYQKEKQKAMDAFKVALQKLGLRFHHFFKVKMMDWNKKLQAGMKDLPKPDEPNIPEPESIANTKMSIVSSHLG